MEQIYYDNLPNLEERLEQVGKTEGDVIIDVCYTFLMMPFYFDNVEKVTPKGEESLWEECDMTIDRGKLYNHIQKFIQSKKNGEGDYQYYSLKNSESTRAIRKMLKLPMTLSSRRSETLPVSFQFCIEKNNSFFSPKLVICGNARVGVLILPVTMCDSEDKTITIRQLCDLNYCLFKTYKKDDAQKESTQNSHIYLKQQADALAKIDEETREKLKATQQQIKKWENKKNEALKGLKEAKKDNKRKGAERNMELSIEKLAQLEEEFQMLLKGIREKASMDIINNIKTINQALQPVDRHCKEKDELLQFWTMLELTERLMYEFDYESFKRFNPYRLHPFTYFRLNQNQFTSAVLNDFVRIINVLNKNYQVLIENCNCLYEQSFRNIYMGSSTEGGGIMTLLPESEMEKPISKNGKGEGTESDDDNPYDFIRNFHYSSLSQAYIWIYLMVLVQRCTLLGVEKELSKFDFNDNSLTGENNTSQKREQLRSLIRRMTQNEINTYFVDISDHTQHNKFYQLCSRNLQIEEYFTDVRRKTRTLKEYLSQLIDQKNEEMVARSEKITRIITIAGIVFALFSGLNDAFDLLGDNKLSLNYIIKGLPTLVHHLLIVLIFLLVPLFSWLLITKYLHSSSKKNY